MPALDIADCINETCPWSGKPVQADSLTEYDGKVVGVCNPGCRDKFQTAIRYFPERIGQSQRLWLMRTSSTTDIVPSRPISSRNTSPEAAPRPVRALMFT